jgi:hypothetical protein
MFIPNISLFDTNTGTGTGAKHLATQASVPHLVTRLKRTVYLAILPLFVFVFRQGLGKSGIR